MLIWKRLLGTVAALAVLFLHTSYAHSVTLYHGALNTTPDAQGWLYLTDPFIDVSATQTAGGGVTTLDTSPAITDRAGYFSGVHPAVPVLDRSTGFTVSFEMQLLAETHSNSNRAGFSMIVVSQDLQAIELGFWKDEIWAQADAPIFTHGEGTPFDTTAGLVQYDLSVLGSDYALFANHAVILQGLLRDYSSAVLPPGMPNPYTLPNLLFFGDDTASAYATINLASVAANTEAITSAHTPEPGTWLLLGTGLVGLLGYSRKRRNVTCFP